MRPSNEHIDAMCGFPQSDTRQGNWPGPARCSVSSTSLRGIVRAQGPRAVSIVLERHSAPVD